MIIFLTKLRRLLIRRCINGVKRRSTNTMTEAVCPQPFMTVNLRLVSLFVMNTMLIPPLWHFKTFSEFERRSNKAKEMTGKSNAGPSIPRQGERGRPVVDLLDIEGRFLWM